MEKINAEFYFGYQTFSSFKEKEAMSLMRTLTGIQYWDLLRFKGFAKINFLKEDNKRKNPEFELLEGFDKKNTNALVFDCLYHEDKNPGKYDKLFVMATLGSKGVYYLSYMFYNTETRKKNHIPMVEGDINDLYVSINQSINSINSEISKYVESVKDNDYKKCNLHPREFLFGHPIEIIENYEDAI